MCDDKEMLDNNKYRDFKTETDDEFEEMSLNGHEHEFPSNTFSELDMNALYSVWKHDNPLIVSVVSDNILKLYKKMICEDK